MLAWGPWVLQVRSSNNKSGMRSFLSQTTNIQTTGGNGLRLDAIKHIDRNFLRQFVRYHERSDKQIPAYIENPHLFVLDTTCA